MVRVGPTAHHRVVSAGAWRARGPVALLAAAVLMLQALAPPGYMPGSLEGGWPVVLCPDGLPSQFLASHPDHAGHAGHGPDAEAGSAAHCPLGSVLDTSSVDLPPILTDIDWLPSARRIGHTTPPILERPRGRASARGPPGIG